MLKINLKRETEVKGQLCWVAGNKCGVEDYFTNLQIAGEELKFKESLINLSNFGTAIGSIERLIILNALKEDKCICQLEAILDKTQSTISHHLRKLERAGLIESYKQRNYTYYSRNNDKLNEYLNILKTELAI